MSSPTTAIAIKSAASDEHQLPDFLDGETDAELVDPIREFPAPPKLSGKRLYNNVKVM